MLKLMTGEWVPVALSSPWKGRIRTIGMIDVDVETGTLNISDALLETLEAEAQHLLNAGNA